MMTDEAAVRKPADFSSGICDLVEGISRLRKEAYSCFKPRARGLCSRDASEREVERLLDDMLDFVESEKVLSLYKAVCRRFADEYPQLVLEHARYCMERLDLEADSGL